MHEYLLHFEEKSLLMVNLMHLDEKLLFFYLLNLEFLVSFPNQSVQQLLLFYHFLSQWYKFDH